VLKSIFFARGVICQATGSLAADGAEGPMDSCRAAVPGGFRVTGKLGQKLAESIHSRIKGRLDHDITGARDTAYLSNYILRSSDVWKKLLILQNAGQDASDRRRQISLILPAGGWTHLVAGRRRVIWKKPA